MSDLIKEYFRIGDMLRTKRKELGFSQTEFAEILGISRPTYSNYENNNRVPDLNQLKDIANILKIHVTEFLEVGGESIIERPNSTGDNIQRVRQEAGLTQAELGKKIGRSEISIRKYESNSVVPKLGLLKKIAEVMDVSVPELIGDDKEEESTLGRNIKRVRKEKGLTQDELGEKLGLSGVAVMRYEKGQRNLTIDKLRKVSEALDIQIEELMQINNEGEQISEENEQIAEEAEFNNQELVDIRKINELSTRIMRLHEKDKVVEYDISIKDAIFSLYLYGDNGFGAVLKGKINEECKSLDKFIKHIEELETEDNGE